MGDTEIGGFGIAASGDLLLIEELVLVQQQCSWATVDLEDASVADFFDLQVDRGLRPEQFARVWVHTHPGNSAQPSVTDEATFSRVFGSTDWAVMFILARGGQTSARLRYHTGPGCEVQLPVEVDYSRPFAGSELEAWQAEYDCCVHRLSPVVTSSQGQVEIVPGERRLVDPWPGEDEPTAQWSVDDWYDAWLDYVEPFDFPQEVSDVYDEF